MQSDPEVKRFGNFRVMLALLIARISRTRIAVEALAGADRC